VNLKIIGMDYYNKFQAELQEAKHEEDVFDTCICGRYLTLIIYSKSKQSQMIFIDAMNSSDNALEIYNYLTSMGFPTSYKDRFMKLFEKLKPDYDSVYDSIELRSYTELKNFASSIYS
jgi:hypothetical protein